MESSFDVDQIDFEQDLETQSVADSLCTSASRAMSTTTMTSVSVLSYFAAG